MMLFFHGRPLPNEDERQLLQNNEQEEFHDANNSQMHGVNNPHLQPNHNEK